MLHRLQRVSAFIFASDDFWSRNLELIPLAAHGFDEHGKVQFATTRDNKLVGGSAILDAQTDIDFQFAIETRA